MRASLSVAALTAFSFALLAAQAPNSSSTARPQTETAPGVISVQTNLVLVRVVVRDRHGNTVPNLAQSDFQLFDDGKPQTIAYFSAEGGAPQPAPVSATEQPAAPSANPASPPSSQRYTALFFDDYHLQYQDLNQTRKAAQGFVTKTLSAGDRVGIFTASGQVTLDFTTDGDKLQKALSALRIATDIAAESGGAATQCPALKDYIAQGVMDNDPDATAIAVDRTTQCVCGNDQGKALQCPLLSEIPRIAKADAQHDLAQSNASAEATLLALQKLVGYIGKLPGERRIGLVSDGFLDRENPARLNQIIDIAIRTDVTISAMDDYGLVAVTPNGDASVTQGYQPQQGDTAQQPPISKMEIQGDEDDAQVMQETAEGTGGVFVHDSNDYKRGFERIGGVAEASYVIGFTPDLQKFDGRFHKLKTIVTAHSNLTVQARPGYFATPPGAEPAESAAIQSATPDGASFRAIQGATTTDQQIQLSQDFLRNYSASQFAEPVSNLLVAAYYSKKDWSDFYASANSALAKYPDDVEVMVLTGWVTAHLYDPHDPGAAAKLTQAQNYLKRAIQIIPALPKPAALTDDQYAAHNKSEILLAHRGLGLVDFYLRDYATSIQELQQATQGVASPDPADLQMLGSALQQLKRYDEAAAVFGECAQISGNLQISCKQLLHQTERDKNKAGLTMWSPPDVDARLPLLAKAQACSLPDVLSQTGERVQELVDNFARFSAHEQVEYDELDPYSVVNMTADTTYDYELKRSDNTVYDYVVTLKQLSGAFAFEETRRVSAGAKPISGVQQDQGLASLALIFHPYYQSDYDMRCEGLSDWSGTPAWVVHFIQRKNKPARTRGFVMSQRVFPEKLKGRAWIAKDSYQVLHIDTNLAEPVLLQSGQSLDGDSISIGYGPVDFHGQNVQLWLPLNAETFTEVARTRFISKESFSDFALFSVQIQLGPPKP
ncbi:MAG: VWA domain-containing protein [Candidatus Acidiferrales bacterium]